MSGQLLRSRAWPFQPDQRQPKTPERTFLDQKLTLVAVLEARVAAMPRLGIRLAIISLLGNVRAQILAPDRFSWSSFGVEEQKSGKF